jgi:hypothetical protein
VFGETSPSFDCANAARNGCVGTAVFLGDAATVLGATAATLDDDAADSMDVMDVIIASIFNAATPLLSLDT